MSKEAVAKVRLEVVPSADLLTQLPAAFDTTESVSVTCLPHHGPARTVQTSVNLARLGYHTVPHLAARSITGEAELNSLLLQLQEAGVSELFLVDGDRRTPAGPYSWSGELLEAVNAYSPDFSIGIAGYPEGHPHLSQEHLSSLLMKAPLASSMVTQMCFSAEAISRYLRKIRKSGIQIPVWVGVPGPVSVGKLVSLGARLGVGRSLKLAHGTGMAGAIWRRGDFLSYDSGRLIREVHQELAGDPLFAGFHVYTFNDLGRLPGLLDDLRALQRTSTLAPGSTFIPLFPAKI
ncbi:methylenetetrahydrofolate reductase [Arthrobacter sp. ISL-30]|uniref:methylenetetrahydrofolate reductase n=1 Tax=Arthrobacter sp. ISL-30 TaxID=2819109 RepID=UPI001BECB585|nr:methylenetetrahydrofolate reductase [Arthrobacter sp. ISL-30]MBT2513868.1 methylenetetrahydrofolate reductase [Arthrobacter sp. ISL-30]